MNYLIKYAYTNGLGSDQPVLYRHMCVPVPNQDLDFPNLIKQTSIYEYIIAMGICGNPTQ
jgi:hypothetical protein